ncbi:hypothetical protein [Priestia megaterium]|uniref:hypothetical protein n=1 Tax=Priestia megaterium TaxID=1404 RepID=UPI00196B320A|nr:hypothetical protein [Priestia megaterium]QSF38455.1 hypothetical protein ICR96_23915 [Priestia megaterium]
MSYLKDLNFNQAKHYKLPKTMFIDDRIMEDARGGHNAVILHMGIADKIDLSRSKYIKNHDDAFRDSNGKFYCVFPVKTAYEELRIKKGKYNQHKALLKEAGLIHFEEQEQKKSGHASRIYITPWDMWVEKNGLYSEGEWIVQPSSKDFYNPKDIVTVQPIIQETNEVEQEQQEETEENELQEYESIMTEAKSLGVKFYKFKRVDELHAIIEKHLGIGKRFINSTVEDLSALRLCYEEMKKAFYRETDAPDF